MSAKQLCASLITRALKSLDEDQEEVVVDYLSSLGIDVDVDTKPKEMCLQLLEKTMAIELGKKVPMSAYANSVLDIENKKSEDKELALKTERIRHARQLKTEELEKRYNLLSQCRGPSIFEKKLYTTITDENVGIIFNLDNTIQHSASISIHISLYEEIFKTMKNPVVEITSSRGKKSYARLDQPHDQPDRQTVYISPLLQNLLGANSHDGAFLRICTSLPTIKSVKFAFYGSQAELDPLLERLIQILPQAINLLSYMAIGLVINTNIDGKRVSVRIDELLDSNDTPIFAGLIAFGEVDVPMEIEPDI